MKKLKLSDGASYFWNDKNERVCNGSQMGRKNILPDNPTLPIKLRLVRLKWVDGDYDEGGAYWGNSNGTHIYWATGCRVDDAFSSEVFVRATNRENAKREVKQLIPGAVFYR